MQVRLAAPPPPPSVDGLPSAKFHWYCTPLPVALALKLALALDCQRGLRDDLRILPMSATLDGARVAQLLGDAPVIASEGRFDRALTPAERDVAGFTIKGYSIAEIAQLRGSAEGTVKTHLNAIYRKAGVTGRGQLVSLLVEDLFRAPLLAQDAQAIAAQ